MWYSKPTMKPTAVITITTKTLRTRSAVVRPTSTADRAIGSDRNRSINPAWRSSARPTPVFSAPNVTDCTQTPAMMKSTYGTFPGIWIAPPKT